MQKRFILIMISVVSSASQSNCSFHFFSPLILPDQFASQLGGSSLECAMTSIILRDAACLSVKEAFLGWKMKMLQWSTSA